MKKVVIFGATSAIATECARLWLAKGYDLFVIGRNSDKLESVLGDLRVRAAPGQRVDGRVADLNDVEHHDALLVAAERALGGLDIVLIAHGTLPDQKACEQSVPLTLREFHTNALSVISLLTLVANRMEKQGAGTVAVISSVAGDRGRQSNYVYGTAKGAVSLFAQGLRNRLSGKRIGVVTVKPGFVDTPMTAAFDKRGPLWAQPHAVAKGIVRAVAKQRDVVYVPWFWDWIMWIIRHIPERMFKRLSL